MSEHSHDKDCGCGHDHELDHEHDHDHGGIPHEHDPEAEALIEGSLIVAKTGAMRFDTPVSADDAVARLADGLDRIAQALAVDGLVAGHIKALLTCDAGSTTVSVTRVGTADIVNHENWVGTTQIDQAQLALNMLSVVNADVDAEAMAEELFFS